MKHRVIATAISLGILCCPAMCRAQSDTGSIHGQVTDINGNPVSDASIAIREAFTNRKAGARTDDHGLYSIGRLKSGDYTLDITHKGFTSQRVQVSLSSGERKKLSFRIMVDNVSRSNASAPVQNAAGSPQGASDSKAVSDLPSNGRDLTQVATLQAGVNSVKTQPDASNTDSGRGQRGFGAQISVSGGRPQQNNYILNGISINDYANSAPGSVLGLDLGADAVEQFTVSTSSYPADYGRSSGGIINAVTRSGGPAFHGSVYEFLRNRALDSKNYFDGVKPRDRILLKLDMTNALRPSELFAFRWKCHRMEAVSLTIVETIYKGKIRSHGKTKGSLTEVPIAKDLSDDLTAWRQTSQEQYDSKKKKHGLPPSDEEAFLFPNRDGSFMDPSNYRKRVLHKLATELGLPKLTFQVIRRTIATLAQRKGTVKDVQGMMRHSRVATTTDVYMQELPEGVRATVDSIHRELQGTMKKLAAKGKLRTPGASAPAAMVH
jgi:hypothetical protein